MTDEENYDVSYKLSDGETVRLLARLIEAHGMLVAAARMREIAAKLDRLDHPNVGFATSDSDFDAE